MPADCSISGLPMPDSSRNSSALPRFRRGPGQGVWLSFVSRRAIRDMHPLLRTARPEMNRGCEPGGIVQRAGLDVAVRISGTAGNVIQADPAVRAEPALHRFHGTGPPSEHLRLTLRNTKILLWNNGGHRERRP